MCLLLLVGHPDAIRVASLVSSESIDRQRKIEGKSQLGREHHLETCKEAVPTKKSALAKWNTSESRLCVCEPCPLALA